VELNKETNFHQKVVHLRIDGNFLLMSWKCGTLGLKSHKLEKNQPVCDLQKKTMIQIQLFAKML
jgi:hypothetical protein